VPGDVPGAALRHLSSARAGRCASGPLYDPDRGTWARRPGVLWDSWDALFCLVVAVSERNTPGALSLAHLVR